MILNAGWFKKGQVSPNRGHTLESWVGEDRAKAIRLKMSTNSKKKAKFLRGLSRNIAFIKKRAASRRIHEEFVRRLVDSLRKKGLKCYVLSEYVKEERTPDAILFDGRKLIALEVEQEKRYKASHEAIRERLESLNAKSGFFDATRLVFVPEGAELAKLVKQSVAGLISKD